MRDPADDATTKYSCSHEHCDSELDGRDLTQHHPHSKAPSS